MPSTDFDVDFDGTVAVVTGASGALGSAAVDRFREAGATVCAVDVVEPDDDDSLLEPDDRTHFYEADLTDESEVADLVETIVDDHGRIDHLLNVAGTWRGGDPIAETDLEEFEFLLDVNLKTAFLASKHALAHLEETEGSIVNVSARSSLEGGEGDGPYRISKAGIRLLTETLAEENLGTVRANCVMPSVIDTPMNREMMPDADHDSWVEPGEIAETMTFLCSDGAAVTSGAAVPVYGEA
ncbi:NAD(P)-dependent dehydrogenase, short-chain alcohol dehydrogenase family [Halobiforma haloterrestris]|uniref:NAD(P)-dependent dehydrogenase, short-chain alcohol dehydrogenase family n=1 Tax=Natronobacterium haloterrestre TaxID=148448 RepID=A0A1I1GCK7_NATHA|nr:SDR family NAD(P)-dependent oxidoreductase [Halobiforma haloterrestris]SFC06860.1 NAD(P)-dependent dehydrogenase, short-chain alcohol dehydrogenase family [Halobiforma haloterrestris]